MVAQALVETGFGTSQLSAAPYYNLFGVKEYNGGPSVSMSTQEYLDGQWVTMNEPFAVYNSYAESFQAHANLLTGSYYAGARKSHTYSYQDAAIYLTGRYATDPGYAGKLISLIQTYNLTRFDTPGAGTAVQTANQTQILLLVKIVNQQQLLLAVNPIQSNQETQFGELLKNSVSVLINYWLIMAGVRIQQLCLGIQLSFNLSKMEQFAPSF